MECILYILFFSTNKRKRKPRYCEVCLQNYRNDLYIADFSFPQTIKVKRVIKCMFIRLRRLLSFEIKSP